MATSRQERPDATERVPPKAHVTEKALRSALVCLALAAGLLLWLPAAGCTSAAKPVSVVVKEGGGYVLDGRTLPAAADLQQALRGMVDARRKAGGALPKVVIQVQSPENVPYESFAAALLSCGAAELERLEVHGVPLILPRSGRQHPIIDFRPAFEPIEIRRPEDLNRLRAEPGLLRDRGILISPLMDTPSDLVIAAMKLIHEAGGTIGMAIPYDSAAGGGAAMTLSHRPLDRKGGLAPTIAPFKGEPFPDVSPDNLKKLEVLGVTGMGETDTKDGKP